MMRAEVRDRINKSLEKTEKPREINGNIGNVREKIILHVDMDAFFAAIEERDNPSLKGKPLVVGGPKGSRGVVTTANYAARKYGIKAGMSLMEADRRCPDLTHASTKGGKYTWVSMELMAILRRFSPKVEPYSIDEAFLDATGCIEHYNGKYEYGIAIKDSIKKELNLTASVGISTSKIIAKIASGMNKPDGITIIDKDDIYPMLAPLPVTAIPGVGNATKEILDEINVKTVDDLIQCPKSLLKIKLGMHGNDLWKVFHGKKQDTEIISMEHHSDDKSMSHEHTFNEDISDPNEIEAKMLLLCDKTMRRLRKFGYHGQIVAIKLRTNDFNTRIHQHKLKELIDDPIRMYNEARKLFDDLWQPGDLPVRLIGVSMSGLKKPNVSFGIQDDLFKAKKNEKRKKLYSAVDRIKDVYGENLMGLAGYLNIYNPKR